jgi:molybdopterin/thiamine biosynthesis adenylyltransferase
MPTEPVTPLDESPLKTVLIAGAGNIGSGLPPMVARIGSVGRVLFVDYQTYEAKNLPGQDIGAPDVGKPKALVQARRLRRINPTIDARAYCERIEDLPLGVLRVDVILCCLDSWIARRYVNSMAWRLGVPWIDAAVDAAGLLVRTNVYLPGPDAICFECGAEPSDYQNAALEQPHPCENGVAGPAATNAPVSLGLVAAGLMATECEKLLAGDREHLLAGRQVMLDLRHHTHYVTSFRRDRCQFDHEVWAVEPRDASPAAITLGEALGWAADGSSGPEDYELRVEGQRFTTMQFCPRCGHHAPTRLRLAGRIERGQRRCPACGGTTVVRGFDLREWVDGGALESRELDRPLSAFGVVADDVLSVRGAAGLRHFVLGGSTSKRPAGSRKAGHRTATPQNARR